MTDTRFARQRLDAYHLALELHRGVELLAGGVPRGHADLKDQLRSYGCDRRAAGQGVAVAAPGRVWPLRQRADRVAAMLVGLLRRERARANG